MTLGFQTIFITIILGFLFQYVAQIIFLKYNIVDKVNKRSSHTNIATRSGGISIFSAIFLISLYYYFVGLEIYDFSFIVPLSLLLITGLYDDIYKMDFKLKFIFQIIAAKIMIDNGLIIDNLHGFLGINDLNRLIAQIITIFVIVAVINSINFIDGIDGLASSIIVMFIILFEIFSNSLTPFYNLSLITISATLPLFYYNFRKQRKIFLGDAGSLFLGGIASTYIIFILTNDYIIKPKFDLHKLLYVIIIFLYPILDIIRVTLIRLYNGRSPFIADKNHIHHLLLKQFEGNHFYVTILILLISSAIIAMTLIIF
tara:strand:- start:2941 stop:3882 length:942 start_codon:yes stop_codon:yes gene_type:complete